RARADARAGAHRGGGQLPELPGSVRARLGVLLPMRAPAGLDRRCRLRRLLDSFIGFAGNLRGRRFGIVAGSSIIAPSAIVASALTAGRGPGSLAAAAI